MGAVFVLGGLTCLTGYLYSRAQARKNRTFSFFQADFSRPENGSFSDWMGSMRLPADSPSTLNEKTSDLPHMQDHELRLAELPNFADATYADAQSLLGTSLSKTQDLKNLETGEETSTQLNSPSLKLTTANQPTEAAFPSFPFAGVGFNPAGGTISPLIAGGGTTRGAASPNDTELPVPIPDVPSVLTLAAAGIFLMVAGASLRTRQA